MSSYAGLQVLKSELNRRKLFLLLSLCSALTACFNLEELHKLLVFGRPGPACGSRNPQPTVCLHTSNEQVISEQPEGPRSGREDLKEWEHEILQPVKKSRIDILGAMLALSNTGKQYSPVCAPVKTSQAARNQDCAGNGDPLAYAAQKILAVHPACP